MLAVLPMLGFISLVLLIVVALGVVGGWVGAAIALGLVVMGLLGGARYVQQAGRTSASRQRLGGDGQGKDEDSSLTDEAQPMPVDLPLGSPARRELIHRRTRRATGRTQVSRDGRGVPWRRVVRR